MADGAGSRRLRLRRLQSRLPAPRSLLVYVRTFLIALGGGWLANAAGLPAGWLSGAMVAVTISVFTPIEVRVPPRILDLLLILLGVILGSGVTPEIVDKVWLWPLSLAGLLVSVVAVTFAVQTFLVRVAGWDRRTAFFAALPGALSYAVALATINGADVRRVAVGQSVRLFLLVALIPMLVARIEPISSEPVVRSVAEPVTLVALIVASLAGSLVFVYLRLPAAFLSGALLVSGAAHGTGLIDGGFPDWLLVATYVALGAMIGCRFLGTSLAFLSRTAAASVGAFLIALVVAGAIAALVASLVDAPLAQILVAFAPGGLDAMTALALALHLDTAFVAVHQLVRFIAIAVLAPFATRALFGRPQLKKD